MEDSNENSAGEGCCDWRATVDGWGADAQKMIRDEPAKAAGFALVGGLLLTVLPIGRLFGGLIRLAFGLVRPALLVLGAMKIYEKIDETQKR